VWIEKRLYELETIPPTTRNYLHPWSFKTQFLITRVKGTNYVFIGELDGLRETISQLAPPMPTLPRQPRLNEIYHIKKDKPNIPWQFKFLGSFTPFVYTTIQ
jgi:hypothetical protein